MYVPIYIPFTNYLQESKNMTAFIIDTYNKYDNFDREHSRYTFTLNGVEYAIKEV
jgi:hypothetical protein